MTDLSSFPHLTDLALLRETRSLVANERGATVLVIAALREIDARQLFLSEGYASLFTFCTDSLHLSEASAYKRITVARASRVFPELLDALHRGALNLSTAVMIVPSLTSTNVTQIVEAASFKKKRDVQKLIAEHDPRPDVRTIVRRQPRPAPGPDDVGQANTESSLFPGGPAHDVAVEESGGRPQVSTAAADALANQPTASMPTASAPHARRAQPLKPAVIAPLSPSRYKIQFTADQETHDKLRRAQALLRHRIPSGDVGTIFNRALTLLIAHLERKKLGLVRRPRVKEHPVKAGSRHIPMRIRRAVWKRDEGRCAFVGAQGRCIEREPLEFHHVVPFAAGGSTTIENIQLRCRAHNKHKGVLLFGEDAMRQTHFAARGWHRPLTRSTPSLLICRAPQARARPAARAARPSTNRSCRTSRRASARLTRGRRRRSSRPECGG